MIWVKRTVFGLLGLVALVLATLYVWSSVLIHRDYEAEPRQILVSSRPDVLAEGERLAQVYGCFGGCHGEHMQGGVFVETPLLDRIIAPNLTLSAQIHSDAELEAMIRQGVRPDGSSLLGMPSSKFASMTDQDLSAIISFIRSYPVQPGDPGRSRYGLLARFLLVTGVVEPEPEAVVDTPNRMLDRQDPLALGEYLAKNACAECHGVAFEGSADFAPPLEIAKAYDLEQFKRLMREGQGLADRDLGLMAAVAKNRFAHLNPEEVAALHEFLHAR